MWEDNRGWTFFTGGSIIMDYLYFWWTNALKKSLFYLYKTSRNPFSLNFMEIDMAFQLSWVIVGTVVGFVILSIMQ